MVPQVPNGNSVKRPKEAAVSAVTTQRIGTSGGEPGTTVRVVLLLIGLPQLAIGLWALISPSGWYDSFPGGGNEWLPVYGPFNEHFAVDIGSTFVAIGLALVIAAVWLDRRAVQLALIAYLAYSVPHFIYHLGADSALDTGDQIANGAGIGLAVVTAILLLGLTFRRPKPAGSPSRPAGTTTNGDGASRLRSRVDGPFARLVRWYGRRTYGDHLAPVDAYLHTRGLLLGYGAFETAVERASRLEALAATRAAQVVECEWCMDFASRYSLDRGVPEEQLREMSLYRESEAFGDLEKLVLDYATAMSHTPVEVTDEMVDRLKEHFDDAQLVELTNAIAIENLRARFNNALDLEPQGFSEGAYCVAPAARAERDESPLRATVSP
jgi:alkylhydroperoxidase family enzyme